ncbi:tRNA dimethylallyltransferase-like isoform X2 [Physella acuta]|nr:tRNA dimethylallyltransferase-like isoform X2 [Physella acuta]
MISYLEADRKHYNVVDFRDKALPIIQGLLHKKKLPVIVGGTNYYIESLLWDFLVTKFDDDNSPVSKLDLTSRVAATLQTTPSTVGSSGDQTVAQNTGQDLGDETLDNSCDQSTSVDSTCGSSLPEDSISGSSLHESSVSPADVPSGPTNVSPQDYSPTTKPLEDYKHDSEGLIACLHGMSIEELYKKLQQVDPVTAARLHPRNKRKVVRALHVYYQTGRTMSAILKEQHAGQENVKSGPLRYPDPCIIWVKCAQPELNLRLDNRVDDMISRGLIQELETFEQEVKRLEEQDKHRDTGHEYSHGILQMIGFKEFDQYLHQSPQERATEQGRKLFQQGVVDLKLTTRRYARQQIKWIKNRFCGRPGPNVPPVYSVDTTDLSQWNTIVQQAKEVVHSFCLGQPPEQQPEPVLTNVNQLAPNICDLCGGMQFFYQKEWTDHLQGRKHRHHLKLRRQREKLTNTLDAHAQNLRHLEAACKQKTNNTND